MNPIVRITGIDPAIRKFRKMPEVLQFAIVGPAMEIAMRPVLRELKNRTPKQSGNLARTANLSTLRDVRKKTKGRRVSVSASLGEKTRSRRVSSKKDKTKAYYGRFPEYGTDSQRAQEFAKGACKATRDAARDRAMDLIRVGVEAAWASL